MIARMATSAPRTAAGSAGVVETQFVDLPKPLQLDCGRSLHPVRVAYETYGTLAPARDNVILVCHALSGDAHAAGVSKTPPPESTRDGFGADRSRQGHAEGARLVGRDDRARQGVRHRSVLRRLHQPARRLPRHHRALVDRPGHRPPLRVGLSGDHGRRHGAHRACVARRAGHRSAGGRGRRVARGDAGVRVGDPLSRPGGCRRRDRQHARHPAARRGVERDRPQRDHGRPGVAGRPLLRHRPEAGRGHGRGAHGGPRDVSLGAVDWRQVRPAAAVRHGRPLHGDGAGVRGRELPASSG